MLKIIIINLDAVIIDCANNNKNFAGLDTKAEELYCCSIKVNFVYGRIVLVTAFPAGLTRVHILTLSEGGLRGRPLFLFSPCPSGSGALSLSAATACFLPDIAFLRF